MKINVVIIESEIIVASRIALQVSKISNIDKISILNSFDLINNSLDNSIIIYEISDKNYDAYFEELKIIKEKNENIYVLLTSYFTNKELIKNVYKFNFSGIIEKFYLIENIELIIRSLIKTKGFYLSPISTDLIMRKQFKLEIETINKKLSKQQKLVAKHLTEGLSYKQISENLGLSLNTTRMHVRLLYKKLNIKNKYQLINFDVNNY